MRLCVRLCFQHHPTQITFGHYLLVDRRVFIRCCVNYFYRIYPVMWNELVRVFAQLYRLFWNDEWKHVYKHTHIPCHSPQTNVSKFIQSNEHKNRKFRIKISIDTWYREKKRIAWLTDGADWQQGHILIISVREITMGVKAQCA